MAESKSAALPLGYAPKSAVDGCKQPDGPAHPRRRTITTRLPPINFGGVGTTSGRGRAR
jgi:hypothetical protein